MVVAQSAALFLVFVCLRGSAATKLCQMNNSWFDADDGSCKPCETCGSKSMELEPCSEFRNTVCVDLAIFKSAFDHKPSWSDNQFRRPTVFHKWHEMETMDAMRPRRGPITTVEYRKAADPLEATIPSKVDPYSVWDIAIIVVLCSTVAALLVAIVITIFKSPALWGARNGSRQKTSRARLFSRDRLSTTEYMNNLATLDRRLAMDEILEKRRKAIFEPQLLAENLYTDDVFVDISGIPRHYDYVRLEDSEEPTRSLLRMSDHDTQQDHLR